MKKVIMLLAVCAFGSANAQVSLKPGVKAGYSASTVTGMGGEYRNNFYLGLYGNLKLTRIYNMQFEMMYLRQGVDNIQSYRYDDNTYQYVKGRQGSVPLDYLSLNLINKFNFDKFSMNVGPGIDFLVSEHTATNNYNITGGNYYEPLYSHNNGVDLTFNFGLGYSITENFGIEARMRQGIIESIYSNASIYSDYSANLNRSFMVGATYTFK
ncbi:MAG: outer membrane beta-barrel protein [Myroides sp.]